MVQFMCLCLVMVSRTCSFTLLTPTRRSGSPVSVVPRSSATTKIISTLIYMAADEDEYAKVPIGRRRQQRDDEPSGRGFARDEEEDDDEDDDDDEYLEEEDDDEDEYGLFSNVIIDNPLLDSIDPDGAAERFPELARDPKFWLDMFLFICVLDFLSLMGPQDNLPDLLWYNPQFPV
jgi:hypothetical protein